MNIYFSGLGGVGIGPLAEIAHDAGHTVTGSDLAESLVTTELRHRGITVNIGQDGTFLRESHTAQPIDWFVYTAALPDDHPELTLARELGLRTSFRDEFLAYIIQEKGLKLIAIAGTHGKTTTAGMVVWMMQQLNLPVSYSIGTTLSYGPAGQFNPNSEYFVYECDEYARNFLAFHPYLSLITAVDYDHPDTYPQEKDYVDAFKQFLSQSGHAIIWQQDSDYLEAGGDQTWVLDQPLPLHLAGEHNRRNATLAVKAAEYLGIADQQAAIEALERFPGTDRRFEKLADNLYTDYGHHPKEIAATLQMAREISDHVALVYQPHQNRRQHRIRDEYSDQFLLADKVYWLPTYLSREDAGQPILSPDELIQNLINKEAVETVEFGDELWKSIETARAQGMLVLCMGAGDIDRWVREKLAENG